MLTQKKVSLTRVGNDESPREVDLSSNSFMLSCLPNETGIRLKEVELHTCSIEQGTKRRNQILVHNNKRKGPTFVNKARVKWKHNLQDGDILGIGGTSDKPVHEFTVNIREEIVPTMTVTRCRMKRGPSTHIFGIEHEVIEVPVKSNGTNHKNGISRRPKSKTHQNKYER
jgi:hypothetical protein